MVRSVGEEYGRPRPEGIDHQLLARADHQMDEHRAVQPAKLHRRRPDGAVCY
jgi:hypothetical protein